MLDGLRWLLRHQNADGSWSAAALQGACTCGGAAEGGRFDLTHDYDEGLTGLALLGFLGAGLGPDSRIEIVDTTTGTRHVAGTAVRAGLEWLAKRQNGDGSFAKRPFLYCEAIATTAICEAYSLTVSAEWKLPARKGLAFLEAAQKENPAGQGLWGWGNDPRPLAESLSRSKPEDPQLAKAVFPADTSVTAWCALALHAGRNAHLEVSSESFSGALDFLDWLTCDNGLVGYDDPRTAGAMVPGRNDHFTYHVGALSALGMSMRLLAQGDSAAPFLEQAAKVLVNDLPTVSEDKLSVDYYYWYYGTVALNEFDGPNSRKKSGTYWAPWNRAVVEAVLSLQDKTEGSCSKGGWMVLDRWSFCGGPLYATALNVLTLETYYRYNQVPRLVGTTFASFQESRNRIRDSLSGTDDELDAALTDAIELLTSAHAALESDPAKAEQALLRAVNLESAEGLLLLVRNRIDRSPDLYSPMIRARVLAPDAPKPASAWLIGRFLEVEERVARAGLVVGPGPVMQVSARSALELAGHGALATVRAQVCADTADWPALVAAIRAHERMFAISVRERTTGPSVARAKDREDVLRANEQVHRAQAEAKLALDNIELATDEPDYWKRVRIAHAALTKLAEAGDALAASVGTKWNQPLNAEAVIDAPTSLADLAHGARKLGPDSYIERAQLAKLLIAHPEIEPIPVGEHQVALFDTSKENENGLLLGVEWLGDPHWRILPAR